MGHGSTDAHSVGPAGIMRCPRRDDGGCAADPASSSRDDTPVIRLEAAVSMAVAGAYLMSCLVISVSACLWTTRQPSGSRRKIVVTR